MLAVPDGATTMMIRNLPNSYAQRDLVRELEALGFAGSFDFVYVPVDKATLRNVGHAFVNFVDSVWASKCMKAFDNYQFKSYRKARRKAAGVSIADIQGLEANLKHFEVSASQATGAPPPVAWRSRQRSSFVIPGGCTESSRHDDES